MNRLSLCRSFKISLLISVCLHLIGGRGAAESAAALTVQIIGGGTVNPNYNGQILTLGNKYSMSAKPKSGFAFTGWSGSQSTPKSKLPFVYSDGLAFTATFVDRQSPVVKFNSVPNSSALTTNSIYVSGSASDNDAVATVYWQLNAGGWQPANTFNAWANWWLVAALEPGTNYLEAFAVDASGLFSKTNRVKLIYDIAPTSLAGNTLTAVRADNSVATFDFGTNVFTEPTGAGNYKYKKLSSVNGQIEIAYTTPPSATDPANRARVILHFSNPTAGAFTDGTGINAFSISANHDWAPATIGGSTVLLADNDGVHQTVVSFYTSPIVTTNTQTRLVNPLPLTLTSSYPGQVGDRVYVAFAHQHYSTQSHAWLDSTPKAYPGVVIAVGDHSATVLMDRLPKNNESDQYAVLNNATLDIITCTYDTYLNETLVTNSLATYDFAATSPDGAALVLLPPDQTEYLTLQFTNANNGGSFYEESYAVTNGSFSNRFGSFSLALAPQIASPPISVNATNGGTAKFTVSAKGSPTLTYQWQFNGTNLVNGTNSFGTLISGVTTTNLTLANLTTNAAGSYRVAVTNTFGSVFSSAAKLSFSTNSITP